MTGPLVVVLAPHEVRHAVLVGVGRDLSAKARSLTPWATETSTLVNHIIGATGELTVAKALNRYWCPDVGGNDHDDGDIAGLEVRTTFALRDHVLPVKDHDADDRVLVLVVGDPPTMRIAGWIVVREARRHPEWRVSRYGRPPRYYVPADQLNEWSTVGDALRSHGLMAS